MSGVILFDLYNTLLIDETYCFENGLRLLYETYFESVCTWEDFSGYSAQMWGMYDEKRKQNIELMLIRDEVPLLFEKFGVTMDVNPEELDYRMMCQMEKETLWQETEQTLKKLYQSDFNMYIVSNSIYLASSNQKLVESFGVMKYFKKLYCSADFGWRKPDIRFFDYVVKEVLEENPNLAREQIFFVGNDYKSDVTGAVNAGLKPVWYNWEKRSDGSYRENTEKYDLTEIRRFSELLEIVNR